MNIRAKRRTTWRQIQVLNRYSHRSGFHALVLTNVLKISAILALLVGAYLLVEPYLGSYQIKLRAFVEESLPPAYVFPLFYVSESILGMIPPDLFMLWARSRFPETPYLMVTILAVISYLGGITAYAIGSRIEHIPRVHAYLFERHAQHVRFMRKWGGAFIIVAALLPIPFAIASTIAGMVEYPFRTYLVYGLARFVRFYSYALVLFNVI
ncbi:short-chain dehydrogenase [Sinimarinibacterium sp. CAU 1509]|uniref:YqaA family protein n=1 Tax=Sinimarinibacterium sp. CAU 1509 TaxID=2562283 RepID=UPI0010ABC147|nr:VTT domain-containing protein [Sinimarinibacterium sp. CAU 1509]TJY61038.1 short-chain dehydrogenase [Sinimarinibacterium sp. CAU 1509]